MIVSTLHIRNGNDIRDLGDHQTFRSSRKYLTYKEWKPHTFDDETVKQLCKYLTYKEYPNLYSQGWNAKTKRRTIDVRHCHL